MDRDWDINAFEPSDYTERPISIHLCAYRNASNVGDEEGNPPTNHWAAFLELEDGRSVRIDPSPGYGSDGQRGKIILSSRDYPYTQNAIKSLSFPIIGSTTVQTFINLINIMGGKGTTLHLRGKSSLYNSPNMFHSGLYTTHKALKAFLLSH